MNKSTTLSHTYCYSITYNNYIKLIMILKLIKIKQSHRKVRRIEIFPCNKVSWSTRIGVWLLKVVTRRAKLVITFSQLCFCPQNQFIFGPLSALDHSTLSIPERIWGVSCRKWVFPLLGFCRSFRTTQLRKLKS